ncbi:unnamed protein product, partial [Ectocarpus sp. 12 AP-2014]
SSPKPLVGLSLGLMQLAEECVAYYHRTIEAALTALHAVGEPEQQLAEDTRMPGARPSDDSASESGVNGGSIHPRGVLAADTE